jgi:hypothetical protein
MATNVTVLGASGSTVTIPFTSAANAAAAQTALNTISDLVRSSALTQYQYPGSGAVPAPSLIGGVVVSGNALADLGLLPAGEYSVVNNADNGIATVSGGTAITLPGTTVVGTYNPMTVASGTGGIVFLNVSSNAQVFLGGGTNIIAQGYAGASANINTDTGATFVDAKMGATTINAFGSSAVQVFSGSGSTEINAMGDNLINVVGAAGSNAVSIFGGETTHNLGYIASGEANTYLAAGADNVTVGGDGTGALTLVGGSGNALVFASHGYIDGGTGTNYLVTDSLAGATTLVSAGASDTLIGQGAGNTYIVSGTNAYVTDFSAASTEGGATYETGGGSATIYGSVAANSTFNLGAGTVLAYGQHGEDLSRGNVYTDAYDGANQITIGDFVVGQDVFSLTNSTSGASFVSATFYADAGTSAFGAVGTQAMLSDGTKIDFLNFNVGQSSFT